MAKIRVSTNPLYKGGAGGYSFYVRSGEQVVRQRKNNSNYGDTASRTFPQMVRRVKWSNLVNMYKIMKSWMPKAFENKLSGQTDYNLFMSLNANIVQAAITKDMSLGDSCIIEPVQVSRGILPALEVSVVDGSDIYKTNVAITIAITSSTTIAELAADIIANNGDFVANDNIAVIKFDNYLAPRVEWPVAHSYYAELTLNTSDNRTIASIPGLNGLFGKSADNMLTISANRDNEVGAVVIHTRKQAASLSVSSQNIVMLDDALIIQHSGEEWVMTCIETYGLDVEVPLDPSFKGGIITQVTANDVVIRNAAVLTGSQFVRLYGNQLYGNGYRLVHDGVDFIPLSSTDDYDEFIITANGSYIIYIDGQRYMSFSVQGISYPAEMTGRVVGALLDSESGIIAGTTEQTTSYCLNYAEKIGGDATMLLARVYFSDVEEVAQSDFEIVGGALTNYIESSSENYATIFITPTSADDVVYMTYKGSIVWVGNYTA